MQLSRRARFDGGGCGGKSAHEEGIAEFSDRLRGVWVQTAHSQAKKEFSSWEREMVMVSCSVRHIFLPGMIS